mmetsp:Transcript_52510/g.139590  ORF Transcript_52510/g.139590 Transcript_52510/m.139590 type:complete len:273 (-) Transcript_52510:922-1740(-)
MAAGGMTPREGGVGAVVAAIISRRTRPRSPQSRPGRRRSWRCERLSQRPRERLPPPRCRPPPHPRPAASRPLSQRPYPPLRRLPRARSWAWRCCARRRRQEVRRPPMLTSSQRPAGSPSSRRWPRQRAAPTRSSSCRAPARTALSKTRRPTSSSCSPSASRARRVTSGSARAPPPLDLGEAASRIRSVLRQISRQRSEADAAPGAADASSRGQKSAVSKELKPMPRDQKNPERALRACSAALASSTRSASGRRCSSRRRRGGSTTSCSRRGA